METRHELITSKKAKVFALVVIVLIILNYCVGIYFKSYPSAIFLPIFVLFISSFINYLLLFKSNELGLKSVISKTEAKRLKIELVCYLLAISSLCLLII